MLLPLFIHARSLCLYYSLNWGEEANFKWCINKQKLTNPALYAFHNSWVLTYFQLLSNIQAWNPPIFFLQSFICIQGYKEDRYHHSIYLWC